MSETILASLDAADLQSRGLLVAGPTGGSHRLHKRRLNRSSDEEHKDIPLNIPPDSPDADDAFVNIPTALITLETLFYIGLSDDKANELWSGWTNWPDTSPRRETDPVDGHGLQVSFIEYIVSHLKNRGTDTWNGDDDAWRASAASFGLRPLVVDAIMDPTFRYLRESESCWYWVRDTVEMRYYSLKDIQRASRERQMALQRAASRPGESSQQTGHERSTLLPAQGAASSSSSTGDRRSISGLQQQSMLGMQTAAWGSTSAIAARNAPGKTILYKGLDQARITGIFDENGTLARIEDIVSSPPSDFSGFRALYYFTPDWKVAEYYAAYAKRRSGCESVVIISIEIPNAAVENIPSSQIARLYWPDPEWKELVWRSRTRAPLLTHMRHYRDKLLILGSISRRPNSCYQQMESWEEVDASCLLRVGVSGQENIAMQYVFTADEDGRDFLLEHGVRSLKVWPYPYSELEAWLEGNAL